MNAAASEIGAVEPGFYQYRSLRPALLRSAPLRLAWRKIRPSEDRAPLRKTEPRLKRVANHQPCPHVSSGGTLRIGLRAKFGLQHPEDLTTAPQLDGSAAERAKQWLSISGSSRQLRGASIGEDVTDQTAAYRKIRIFVASPGELLPEREQLTRVIDEIRLTLNALAPEKNVMLELIRWETHVHPGLGRNPQDVINQQIGDYDIFVGLLWKRMGTPTAVAESGTEEEFRRAYQHWNDDKSLPVLFYFCQEPIAIPRTPEELEQLKKVVNFRSELSDKGLVWNYTRHDEFADTIRPHLLLVLGKMLSPATSAAESVAERTSEAERAAVRQQIAALAQEYDQRRARMDPGPARTRAMEEVVSEMRKLAFGGYALLPELTASPHDGMRLAAIVILQSTPNLDYVPWLGSRPRAEVAFIAYHAAVALLFAVRGLGASARQQLLSAIDEARRGLLDRDGDEARRSDRWRVLDQAEQELQAGS